MFIVAVEYFTEDTTRAVLTMNGNDGVVTRFLISEAGSKEGRETHDTVQLQHRHGSQDKILKLLQFTQNIISFINYQNYHRYIFKVLQ